jgi:hypothetical protein
MFVVILKIFLTTKVRNFLFNAIFKSDLEKARQTDGQIGRQTDRETERKKDRQIHRETDRKTDR